MTSTAKPIITLLLLVALAAPLSAQKANSSTATTTAANAPLRCKAPSYLRPGDKVALVSPSYAVSSERITQAAEVLRQWGFVPVTGAYAGESYLGPYAGTDKERLTDLRWALRDTSIKAIFCNRGGYGAIHYYGLLRANELSENPKWIIGFSDITTLLCMENSAGVMGIHAIIAAHLGATGGNDPSSTLVRDMLTGTLPRYELPDHPFSRKGKATGILLGGNLSTFVALLGSDNDCLRNQDIILFIEEVGESLHHIDRMINILKIHGVWSRCKGVILGNFSEVNADLGYGSAEALFCSYLSRYKIPILCGFPAGHCKLNLPLVMGAPVTLDVRNDGATLTFNMEGNTQTIDTKLIADTLKYRQQPQPRKKKTTRRR